jgi:hypothetical protein
VPSPLVNPFLWAILGLVTSIPFSPSAMGFPLFCFLVAILQSIRLFSRRVEVLVTCVLLFFFIPISLGILSEMKNQSDIDARHIKTISQRIQDVSQGKTQTVILIENPPETKTLPSFNLYMQECIGLLNCMNPAIQRLTNTVSAVYFKSVPEGVSAMVLPFSYDPKENELIAK